MLTQAVQRHASDLMLTPGEPPLLRIDGQWSRLHDDELTEQGVGAEQHARAVLLHLHGETAFAVHQKQIEIAGVDIAIDHPGVAPRRMSRYDGARLHTMCARVFHAKQTPYDAVRPDFHAIS